MTTTNLPAGYSPVTEAEHYLTQTTTNTRITTARQLLNTPNGRHYQQLLDRAPAPAVARHLDGALHVLTHQGWTQNHMADQHGVCLLKALLRAAELGYGQHPEEPGIRYEASTAYVAGTYLNLLIHAATGRPQWYLAWNDEPDRTRDEVLDLVRDAATLARTA